MNEECAQCKTKFADEEAVSRGQNNPDKPSLKDLRDRYFDKMTADVGAARAKKTVERIFWSVRSSAYPCDWLKQNPALKAVCKDVGIYKSGELRALIKESYGDEFLPYEKIGDEPSPISFDCEKKSKRIK